MRKVVISICLFVSWIISLFPWFTCERLADKFGYSSLDVQLRLIESIHTDSGVPVTLVRVFHNKFVGAIIDIFHNYLQYWDIRFLVSLVGFPVCLLALVGIYIYLRKQKKEVLSSLIVLLFLLVPILSIMLKSFIPYPLLLIIYSFTLFSFALNGVTALPQTNKVLIFIVLGLFVSIWWVSVYTPDILEFCIQ